MADFFYIIKPITGSTINFAININGTWNDRNTSNYQKILTSMGVTRQERVMYYATIVPDNKRTKLLSEFRYFKGTVGRGEIDSYYTDYEEIVSYLERSSYWTEVNWETFKSDNNARDIPFTDNDNRGAYTTNSTIPYCLVLPSKEEDFLIAKSVQYEFITSLTNCTCNIPSGTMYDSGTTVTAILTPKSGYTFNRTPTITGSTGTWTKVNSTWQCTFEITSATTITAVADKAPVYYPVTYNLSNATTDYHETSVLAGTAITVHFTPDSGYELFTTPPTLETPTGTTYAINQESQASFSVYGGITVDGPLTITANASLAPVTVPVQDLTEGFTVSPSVTAVPYNVAFECTLTPLEHHTVSVYPTIAGVSMTKTGDSYTATIYPRKSVVISGVATEDSYVTVAYELSGATATPPETTKYYQGYFIHLDITADTGLYFETPPYVVYQTRWGTQVKESCTPVSGSGEYPTMFYWEYDTGQSMISNVTLKGVAQAIPEIDDFGVFNVYAPSLQNLNDIANMRYSFSTSNEYYFRDVDLGDYVLSLMKVYVPIPTAITAEIVLGGYRTGVSSPTITYPYSTVSCGSVSIREFWHTNIDYENTTLKMYIPFFGFKELETDMYMNKEVSLNYDVELITGNALVTIMADGRIVETVTCKVAFDIPYLLSLDKDIVGKYKYNEYLLMDKTPYIEQWSTQAMLTTQDIRGNMDKLAYVHEMPGYQEFTIWLNNVAISKEEKDEIIALCKRGIII